MFESIESISKGIQSKGSVWDNGGGYDEDDIIKELQNFHDMTCWSINDLELPIAEQFKMGSYKFYHNRKKLGFGFFMGSVYTPFTWYHELAHCLEFVQSGDVERLENTISHEFNYPEVELMGQTYNEPVTSQGVYRELRTFAIQLHLMEKDFGVLLDKGFWIKDTVTSLKYVADFCYVAGLSDSDKLLTCEKELLSFYEKISFAGIDSLYKEVLDVFNVKVLINKYPEDTWYDDII